MQLLRVYCRCYHYFSSDTVQHDLQRRPVYQPRILCSCQTSRLPQVLHAHATIEVAWELFSRGSYPPLFPPKTRLPTPMEKSSKYLFSGNYRLQKAIPQGNTLTLLARQASFLSQGRTFRKINECINKVENNTWGVYRTGAAFWSFFCKWRGSLTPSEPRKLKLSLY